MKLSKSFLYLLFIIPLAILCQQIVSNSVSNQANKNAYAELNNVKYGLLSVDEWKRQISGILSEEINKLYLSRTDEKELKKHIEILLDTLIGKVDEKIKEKNTGSVKGWVTQSMINLFFSLKDIKKGVPEYADAVIQEMKKAKTKEQLQSLLNKRLEEYSNQTFDVQDTSELRRVLLWTGTGDVESAKIKVDHEISIRRMLILKESMLMIFLSVVLFAFSGFSKGPLTPSRYLLLVLTLVLLLIAGVTTPMIDLEAKISQINFMLMGHPVHFENQVLYFQSKSILNVFWILINHQDIQMKFVGALVITFSIIFPLLKIISSLGYYGHYHRARENPVIKFFVLKSGKWSMADVMVIAIFMSYIGFNGIITNEFSQLKTAGQDLVVLATNGTSLQPGYYLFLTYTLLALFFSGFLTRKPLPDGRKSQ